MKLLKKHASSIFPESFDGAQLSAVACLSRSRADDSAPFAVMEVLKSLERETKLYSINLLQRRSSISVPNSLKGGQAPPPTSPALKSSGDACFSKRCSQRLMLPHRTEISSDFA